jgi:epoxyqueuosine reductase
LAVCPWNKYAKKTNNEDFFPRKEFNNPKLKSFLKLDDDNFRKLFSTTSIKRIGRNRFLRNVLIAIGNSGDDNFINDITPLLLDNSHLVRAMAVWSLSQLCDKSKFKKLKNSYYHSEKDKDVINEWELT